MTRHVCLIVAVEPNGSGVNLTLEFGDGHREEYRAPVSGPSDELLAHAVEVERFRNPATNKARVRTLSGDWFEVARNYPQEKRTA